MNLKELYHKLYHSFGPQGWWPIFNTKTGKCEYFQTNKCAFEVCVGAILTQNTAWKNVEIALKNLSLREGLSHSSRRRGNPIGFSPKSILAYKNLEKLIHPAGYYNQKAKKLRIFSEWWINSRNLSTIPLIALRLQLTDIWGIGKETADSMLLYAFNKPIFVIDAYTKRLCKEFGVEFREYDEYREFFESQLPSDAQLFNEYHALIVAWGKLYGKNRQQAINIIK